MTAIKEILSTLRYEMIDSQSIYYRGYYEVLTEQKEIEAIVGSTDVQGLVVSSLLKFLFRNLSDDKYRVLANEIGLYIDKNNSLCADIAIYSKALLQKTPLKNKYFDIPPAAVIEIDTKADTSSFNTAADYYHTKTEKLFSFGVQEVIWLFSGNRKVMVARPQQDWLIKDWSKPVTLLDQYTFSVADLIEKGGIKLPS